MEVIKTTIIVKIRTSLSTLAHETKKLFMVVVVGGGGGGGGMRFCVDEFSVEPKRINFESDLTPLVIKVH